MAFDLPARPLLVDTCDRPADRASGLVIVADMADPAQREGFGEFMDRLGLPPEERAARFRAAEARDARTKAAFDRAQAKRPSAMLSGRDLLPTTQELLDDVAALFAPRKAVA